MRTLLNKIVLVVVAGIFLTGCEENAIPELTVPLDDNLTRGKFFFHAQEAPSANFYIDGEKVTAVNSTTSDEEQGSTYGSVYPSNAYAVIPSGSVDIVALDLQENEIASTEETLSEGANYSIYLVGTAPNYEVFTMEDNLPPDDRESIYWRFVNTMAEIPFSVDAYAIRAAVPATDNSPAQEVQVIELGSDIGYKEGGEYVELEPGNYTFKVFDSTSEYDPLTSTPYLQHSLVVASLGRAYTTHIRGTYSDPAGSGKIDFWRDR